MTTNKPKIALLFCGGSALVDGEKVISVKKAADMKAWVNTIPEINLIAKIESIFVFGGDASEMQPRLWVNLIKQIYKNINKYDGFVVTHGIDTMLFTSAMTTFMLQGLNKPIIFTGSPLSSEVIESDKQDLSGLISNYKSLGVKANIINAIQVATMDIAEVGIMFGNKLIKATKAVKSDTPTFNFFDAYQDGLLGKVDFGIKIFDKTKKRNKDKVRLVDSMEENICLLQLYPGASVELLQQMIDKDCQGIIVRSFNTNLFPDSYRSLLKEAYKKKIPIVAHNQSALDIKKKKKEYILVNDQTFETTFVKFMWALGQTRDLGKLRIIMWQNGI